MSSSPEGTGILLPLPAVSNPWLKIRPLLTHHGVILLAMILLVLCHGALQFFLPEAFLVTFIFIFCYLLLGLVNQLDRAFHHLLGRGHYPLQKQLLASRLPRALSIAFLYGLLVSVFALLALKLGPKLQHQVMALRNDWPHYVARLSRWSHSLGASHPLSQLIDHWMNWLWPKAAVAAPSAALISPLRTLVVSNLFQVGSGTLRLAIYSLTSLVMLFYVLLDGATIKQAAINRMPLGWRPFWANFFSGFHLIASEFVTGQMILAVIGGSWMALAYALLGVPYVGLLALVFMLASFVPVIGVWIGALPGFMLLIARGNFVDVVGLVIALAGLAWVRIVWLHPLLFQHRQFFHPAVAIILLLIVLQEGGLWGVAFYYPLASLLATINWLYGPNRSTLSDEATLPGL